MPLMCTCLHAIFTCPVHAVINRKVQALLTQDPKLAIHHFHVSQDIRHAKSSLSSGFSAAVSQRERLGDEPACKLGDDISTMALSLSLSLFLSCSLALFLLSRPETNNMLKKNEPHVNR